MIDEAKRRNANEFLRYSPQCTPQASNSPLRVHIAQCHRRMQSYHIIHHIRFIKCYFLTPHPKVLTETVIGCCRDTTRVPCVSTSSTRQLSQQFLQQISATKLQQADRVTHPTALHISNQTYPRVQCSFSVMDSHLQNISPSVDALPVRTSVSLLNDIHPYN